MDSYNAHVKNSSDGEQLRVDNFTTSRNESGSSWRPEDAPDIQPRPIIVCDRCRKPFDCEREVSRDWFDTTRCPFCGKKNSKLDVLCERSVIKEVRFDTDTRGLYLIQAGDRDVKIGISENIRGRVDKMQSDSPLKLSLVKAYDMDSAGVIEKEIHERLSNLNTRGEWFAIPDRGVDYFVKTVDAIIEEHRSDGEVEVVHRAPGIR